MKLKTAGGLLASVIGNAIFLPVFLVCYWAVKPVNKGFRKRRQAKQKAIARQNAVIYKPVRPQREIRLIHLLPSRSQTSEIECTSFHGEWGKSSYEALSYVWGNANSRRAIKVDGRKFLVTKNLYAALKALRNISTPRTFWIDGICIDQGNFAERSEQVQQMRDIYGNASNVIVWLGKGNKKQEAFWDHFHSSDTLDDKSASSFASEIFRSKWWKRIWVIQELLVARKVEIQYGRHTISWPGFCQLITRLEAFDRLQWRLQTPKTMIRLREVFESSTENRLGLLSLAWEFRDRKASDDRDKLFALLGLLPSEDRLITPRYSENTQRVFKDFAVSWINHYGSLFILNIAGLQSWQRSWYPHWRRGFRTGETLFWNENLVTHFWPFVSMEVRDVSWHGRFSAAGGHPAPNCNHPVNKDILHLRGFFHDKIKAVSETFQLGGYSILPEEWEASMTAWRDFACEATGLAAADIEKEFHLTVTAGFFDYRPTAERAAEYENVRHAACQGRCFFVTSTGSFGLGPDGAKVGDYVCVLLGAVVPFILREDEKAGYHENWDRVPPYIPLVIDTLAYEYHAKLSPEEKRSRRTISHSMWSLCGEAYVREIMNYDGDIESDISSGRLLLEDFYVDKGYDDEEFKW